MSFYGNHISDRVITEIVHRVGVSYVSGADTVLLPPFGNNDSPLPFASLSCILPYRKIPFSGLDCRINGADYHVEPGECFFCAPGSRRWFSRRDDGHRSIWVHLNVTVKPDLQLLNFFDVPVVIRGKIAARCRSLMNLLNRKRKNILRGGSLQTVDPGKTRSFQDHIEDRAVSLLLLKEILQLSKPKKTLFLLMEGFHEIEPAIKFIQERCFEKISLEDLAAVCHSSKSSFEKKFRGIFGVSPGKYLLDLRLAETEQMLKNTDDTCGQIAEKTGFANQFIFSRDFRKRYGVSPSEYRKREIIP